MTNLSHHDQQNSAVAIATRLAQRLAHRLGLAADHADDLRQELLVDLLAHLTRFDASRSPFTAASIDTGRHAQCRAEAAGRARHLARADAPTLRPNRLGISVGPYPTVLQFAR